MSDQDRKEKATLPTRMRLRPDQAGGRLDGGWLYAADG